MTINAVVIPGGAKWKSQGIVADSADIVVTRNRQNGKIEYAIIGDTGPANSLGEGTVALAASLGGVTLNGTETYSAIKKLALRDVDYLILPSYDVKKKRPGPITQSKINELGAEAFEAWGGVQRLDSCKAELKRK